MAISRAPTFTIMRLRIMTTTTRIAKPISKTGSREAMSKFSMICSTYLSKVREKCLVDAHRGFQFATSVCEATFQDEACAGVSGVCRGPKTRRQIKLLTPPPRYPQAFADARDAKRFQP